MIPKEIVFDIETSGLSPIKDRVTAIGLKTNVQEIVIMDNDESKILERFWRFLSKFPYYKLIGFNSYQFDHYFINIRCFKLNVKIIDIRSRIVDLRSILAFGGRFKNGTLSNYAELLGESKYDGLSGQLMVDAWKNRKLSIIEKYLRQDLKMTYRIFWRCKEIGLI